MTDSTFRASSPKYVFFDLDGTLTDSSLGITNAIMHVLRHFNLPVPERSQLYPFIGPLLSDSFQKYYGFSEEKARSTIAIFREYFEVKGIFENALYPGIYDLLQQLCAKGLNLVVTSSKPKLHVDTILDYFKLTDFFHLACGASMDERKSEKHLIIQSAIEQCGDVHADNTIVVGDHPLDVRGAHVFGLPACAVLYGFGSEDEIRSENPDYVARTVSDLKDVLAHWSRLPL